MSSPVSLATFAGALAACGYALVHLGRAVLASRWPTVEGEIAGARLVHRTDPEDSANHEYVAYRYEVDGRPYRNDRLRFGPQIAPKSILPTVDPPPTNDPWAAAALEQRYPTGRPVRVYYNPRRPQDSVLHVAPAAAVWVILGAALLFLYISARDLFW